MANLVSTTINGNINLSGNSIVGKNTIKYILSVSSAGSYVWSTLLNNYYTSSGFFESQRLYRFIMYSTNGAHYHGYRGFISTGDVTSGTAAQRFVVRNVTACHSGWPGGCGGNPWTSIDNNGFTYYVNPCFEAIDLVVEDIG